MDDRLGACLNAVHVVSHGVEARLGRVDLDDVLELVFAARQLVLPELAAGLALLDHERLRVLGVSDHLVHEVRLVDVRGQAGLIEHPTGGQPSSDSSSHFFDKSNFQ